MKALVGAFNQEKALVGAFSVIVQPVVEPMEHYTALTRTPSFDLSRVARPHQLSLQPAPAPGSAPPVSTFRATCPALLRDQLERVDAADTRAEKADIFLFSAAYRPPLAPRLHSDRARHGSLPDAANSSSVRVKSGIMEAP